MARAALTIQTINSDGLYPTLVAATADGHAFDNSGQNVLVYVLNEDASPVDVTFETPITIDGEAVDDKVVAVPAGEFKIFGPFKRGWYNQDDSAGDTGIAKAVFVDTSTQTSVTYGAMQMGSV